MTARPATESFFSRWQTLNDWLIKHRSIWQPAPFTELQPAWVEEYPGLAQMMAGFTDDECAELAEAPERLAKIAARHLSDLALYGHLTDFPDLAPDPSDILAATLPEIRATDMPGRKREQTGAFAAALKPLQQPILDWCCGKGHLARTLAAQSQNDVAGYEWNPKLVADGNRLARRFADAVQISCQDVMAQDLPVPAHAHGVALHACGDLHRQLLKRGVAGALPRLSVSPCCYHKTVEGIYNALSEGSATHEPKLLLDRSDLRLAVRETVTAPAGVRAQTKTLSQWRLGFDGLQRALRGVNQYLSAPSYPPRLIKNGFPEFCHWAASKKQLCLPNDTDFEFWLSYGVQRHRDVHRYELLRHLFRRPLELWMVLDYAVFLEEQGYQVRLGHFCERSLTPRNLLLDAIKKKAP
ncbi:methyltransferase [uncultured Marinobacter sp.]|uniref:methyltransferase n=1 Tax=uncultured Marinobacter sp. TaxID=187379 RepID=UPI0026112217|nr:methyltransferase [uncultured Marinobacter sp.]